MALISVKDYMKNLTKSVAYTVADIGAESMPNTGDILETNKQFFTTTYAVLKNPAASVKRGIASIQQSKVYQALDYGLKNASQDLRTGNFYNKAREDKDMLKLAGLDTDDWNDLSDFGVDSDWESSTGKSKTSSEITDGDKKIVESVEATSMASTNTIVNATYGASNAQIKADRANTAMLYMQQQQLFQGLHSDVSALDNTMKSMHNLLSNSLQNIDSNMANFFTQSLKLDTERNAILKEMLQMQRNQYKSAAEKEAETRMKKKPGKARWKDIALSGGGIDFNAYFDAVKKNIASEISGMGIAGFSDDSNMLATFMVSPLKGVMKTVVDGVIPATVKVAMQQFDDSIAGIFGNIFGRLDNARNGRSVAGRNGDGGIFGMLGKLFGIGVSPNSSIDTSKYEKGPVPFDGITRKAITDVIPTYLRRIEAAITGRPEEGFDYSSGTWKTMHNAKAEYKNVHKTAVSTATADVRRGTEAARKAVKFNSKDDQKDWDKAWDQFWEYLYSVNGEFYPDRDADYNGIKIENRELRKYYNQIAFIFSNYDMAEIQNKYGRKNKRRIGGAAKTRLAGKVMDAKQQEENAYRQMEQGGLVYQYFASGGDKNVDRHGKWDSKDKFNFAFQLGEYRDSLGNTMYDYLKNINQELAWQRESWGNMGVWIEGGSAALGGGGGSRTRSKYKGKSSSKDWKQNSKQRSTVNYDSIRVTNKSKISASDSDLSRRQKEQQDHERRFLADLAAGKGVDYRDYDIDPEAMMANLGNIMREAANNEYAGEVSKNANKNSITRTMARHAYKDEIATTKEMEAAIKKAQKESEKDTVKLDEKETSFLTGLFEKLGQKTSFLGDVTGASAEAITNILYTADQAIYDMFFKSEIKDGDGEKYEGFLDMMGKKIQGAFKDTKDSLEKNILAPFKEAFWGFMGIEPDEFKERFSGEIKGLGKKAWGAFKDANKEVYGPAYHQAKVELGLAEGESMAKKARKEKRSNTARDIERAKSNTNLFDEEFIKMLSDHGLAFTSFDSNEEAQAALLNILYQDMYKATKGMTELSTDASYAKSRKSSEAAAKQVEKYAMMYANTDIGAMKEVARNRGYIVEGEDLKQAKINFNSKMASRKGIRNDRNEVIALAKQGNYEPLAQWCEGQGFKGNIREKKNMLIKMGVPASSLAKIKDENQLNLTFARTQRARNAKGTSGVPFSGNTMLSKNELVFSGNGSVTRVPETGYYNISSPSHILNSESSYDLMKSAGVSSKTLGVRSTVQQDLGRENLAAKNIAKHAEGTEIKGVKVNNKAEINEYVKEAKSYIPEAAAGGVVGGVISTVLGLVGGPLVGAAVGAGTSLIAKSDKFKDIVFGKVSEKDGERQGGIVSKTVMDTVKKYAPDALKYGLAGVIPGLLTPLGPLGGLAVGAGIGILKNNENFTNKYFGEGGKMSFSSKEKKIIEKLIPGAAGGAAVGTVAGFLFGGPFGLVGNAAIGSVVGMITTTDEFKELFIGKEVNGQRIGGLFNNLKDSLEPIGKTFIDLKDSMVDLFDTKIIKPLMDFAVPAIHQLPRMISAIPKAIIRATSETMGRALDGKIGDLLKGPINTVVKAVTKPVKAAANVATLPFQALGAAGNRLREHQIKNGTADYMTANDRLSFMASRGKEYDRSKLDTALAGIGTQNGLSVEAAKKFMDDLSMTETTTSAAKQTKKEDYKAIEAMLDGYKTASGAGLAKEDKEAIRERLQNGDIQGATDMLRTVKVQGEGRTLTENEYNGLMNGQGGMHQMLLKYGNSYNRLSQIQNATDADRSAAAAASKETLMSLGFSEKDAERLLTDKFAKQDLIKLFNTEVTNREAGEKGKTIEDINQDSNQRLKDLVDASDDMNKWLMLIATGRTDEAEAEANRVKQTVRGSKKAAQAGFKQRKENVKNQMGAEEYGKMTNAAKDRASAADASDPTRKLVDFLLGNRLTGGIARKAGLDNPNNNVYNKINKFTKRALKYNFSAEIINAATSKNDGKEIMKLCKDHFDLDQGAVDKLENMSPTHLKIFNKFVSNRDVQKIWGGAKITQEDIDFCIDCHGSIKEFLRRCAIVADFGKTAEDYPRFESIMMISGAEIERMQQVNEPRLGTKAKRTVRKAKKFIFGKASHGLHWLGKQKKNLKNRNKYSSDPGEMPNGEPNPDGEPIDEAGEPVPQNGLGTMLLSGLGSLASGALGLVGKGISSLLGLGSDDKGEKAAKKATATGPSVVDKAAEAIKGGNGGGNLDEVDKKGDGKNVVQIGTKFAKVEKGSDGSVELDTSDSNTKEIVREEEAEKDANAKLRDAQIAAAEATVRANDTSDIKESKGGKLGWMSLLMMGGLLWKSGVLQKLYDNVIKPLWTDKIYPWITDTALPWITDTALPWITDTALPAIGNALETIVTDVLPGVLSAAASGLVDLLVNALPSVISAGIKGVTGVVGGVLDAVTGGNTTNAGSKTTVDASSMVDSGEGDTETVMYDENGNTLTYQDIADGNYEKIYNAAGVEGTVNDDGTVTFKDQSVRGSSYAKKAVNALTHATVQGKQGALNKLVSKGSSALSTAGKFLTGKSGSTASKVVSKIPGSKLLGRISQASSGIGNIISAPAKAGEALSGSLTDALERGVNASYSGSSGLAAAADSLKTDAGYYLSTAKDWLSNTKVGKAASKVADKADDAVTTLYTYGDDALKAVKNTKIGGKVADALDTAGTTVYTYADDAVKAVSGKASTVVESLKSSKVGSFVSNVGSKIKTAVKGSTDDIAKVAASSVDDVAEAAAETATKAATSAGSTSKLATLTSKAGEAISNLFGDSKVVKKISNAASALGIDDITSWISKFKDKVTSIFGEALEKGVKEASEETVKKAVSKVNLILTVVTLVTDFLTGCDQAESILGVTETSLIEEVVAGLINALCNLLIIPAIIPGVNWIARKLYNFFGDNLDERQAEADEEYEAYKEETGSTESKEEYLKSKYSVTGKVGSFVKNTIGKAGNAIKNSAVGKAVGGAVSTVGKGVKAVGSGIVSGVKSIGSGIKNFFTGGSSSSDETATNALGTTDITNLVNNLSGLSLITADGSTVSVGDVTSKIQSMLTSGSSDSTTPELIANMVGTVGNAINSADGDTLTQRVTNAAIGLVGDSATTFKEKISSGVSNLAGKVSDKVSSVKDAANDASLNALSTVSSISSKLGGDNNILSKVLSAVDNAEGDTLIDKAKNAASGAVSSAKEVASNVVGKITDKLGETELGSKILDGVSTLKSKTSSALSTANNTSLNTLGMVSSISNKLGGNNILSNALNAVNDADGNSILEKSKNAASSALSTAKSTASNLVSSLYNKIANNAEGTITADDLGLATVGAPASALSEGTDTVASGMTSAITKIFGNVNNASLMSNASSKATDTEDSVIEQVKNGELSIFSQDYWNIGSSNNDDLQTTVSNTYTWMKRITNFPSLLVQTMLKSMLGGIGNIGSWVSSKFSSVSEFFTNPLDFIYKKITGQGEKDENGNTNDLTSISMNEDGDLTYMDGNGSIISQYNTATDTTVTNTNTTTTATTDTTNGTTTSSGKTGFVSKVKNTFGSLFSSAKKLFGFGSGPEYVKQIDPSVANLPYNASYDTEYQTIGDSACGPAAAVNAVRAAYGRGSDLIDASNYALAGGYKEQNGGTYPEFFSDYFNANGLGSSITSNRSAIADSIRSGNPTVLMGQDANGTNSSNPFGKTSHYVTVTGTDSYGRAVVQDPESKYDNQLYDVNDLMRKTTLGISAYGKRYGRGNRFGRGKLNFVHPKFGRGWFGRGGTIDEEGTKIDIPDGLGGTFTYMGWQCITSKSSTQYKLRDQAGQNFDDEGFGIINGRFVIACTTTFGDVGDYVDFVQSDGTVFQCVIGDIKNQNDSGCTQWGHLNGKCVVEFVVDKDTWYSNGKGAHSNPGSSGFHSEWGDKTMSYCLNHGSYFDDPDWTGGATGQVATTTDVGSSTTSGTTTTSASDTTNTIGGTLSYILSNSKVGKLFTSLTSTSSSNTTSSDDTTTSGEGRNRNKYRSGAGKFGHGRMFGRGKFGRSKYGRGNAEKIWYALKQAGFTDQGAAATMGNLEAESGMEPTNLQNTYNTSLGYSDSEYTNAVDNGSYSNFVHDSAGYGLAQWTYYSRKQNLLDAVNDAGASVGDLSTQVSFLLDELSSGYSSVYKALKNATDVTTASNKMLHDFESPADQSSSVETKRASMGQAWYDQLKGTEGEELSGITLPGEATSESSSSSSSSDSASDTASGIFDILSDILANSKAGQILASLTGSSSSSTSTTTSDGTTTSSDGSSTVLSDSDAANMVNIASNEVGTHETGTNYVKYNDWFYGYSNAGGSDKPWCAAFVSWVANQAGISESIMPKTASTKNSYSGITGSNGGSKVSNSDARAGDIAFFTKSGTSDGIYHTGIVTGNDGSTIYTVEGNSSDQVAKRSYNVGSSSVLIARPAYENQGSSDSTINITNSSEASDTTTGSTQGGNGYKPISKYGTFRDSLSGMGARRFQLMSKDGSNKTEEIEADRLIGQEMKSRSRKNTYHSTTGSGSYGRATEVTNYEALLKAIIQVLMTIADNTDKLNTVVNLLTEYTGMETSSTQVSEATSVESLKSKINGLLGGISGSGATSGLNSTADSVNNSSITTIMNALNAIAAE